LIVSKNISRYHGAFEPSACGWFALVCNIQEPQKQFLDSLRHSIPGRNMAPAHITILPPRPLRFPIDRACTLVADLAHRLPAFAAELSDVRCFSETDFIYLDIAEGSGILRDIHQNLNSGELNYNELYEFRPHLTLGGPVIQSSLQGERQRIEREWKSSECPRRILIEELVCLWMDPENACTEWTRYRSFFLRSGEGRIVGGRPEAHESKMVS
jgi:2'-5' RNA ligase